MPPRRSSRNTKAGQETAEASTAEKRELTPAVAEPEKPGPSKKPRATAKNGKKKAASKATEKEEEEPVKEEEPKKEEELKKEEESTKEEVSEAPKAEPEAKPTTRRRAGATPVDPFSGLTGKCCHYFRSNFTHNDFTSTRLAHGLLRPGRWRNLCCSLKPNQLGRIQQ